MSFKAIKPVGTAPLLSLLLFALAALFPACTGGGTDDSMVGGFNNRSITLYTEVPEITVTGNVVSGNHLMFYPYHPNLGTAAGLCDTDSDGVLDTQINSFQSFCNAANNIFNEELAACIQHGSVANPVLDHYNNNAIWDPSPLARPNVMPAYAIVNTPGGEATTAATQFIQVVLPFNVDPASLFDTSNTTNNFCASAGLTIIDEDADPVVCSVFLNGRDAFDNDFSGDANWPTDATIAPNVIVLIANTKPASGNPHIPTSRTAFTSNASGGGGFWDPNDKELYLRIDRLSAAGGGEFDVFSKHAIRRDEVLVTDTDVCVKVASIAPVNNAYVKNPYTGQNLEDNWPGVVGTQDNLFVSTDTTFHLTFNKPVVPVTVGQSVVFNRAPFNGNLGPLSNIETMKFPPNTNCASPIEPICPNVAVRAFYIDETGAASTVTTPIPFRVYPRSQNNMAEYYIKPLIALPGSSTDWSGDNIPGQGQSPPTGSVRMRIQVVVYEYMLNDLTGDPDGKLLNGTTASREPQNLCVGGFHGERFLNNGSNETKSFSVLLGRRYVNAPVSPNVIYYSMGTNGIGAVDLDGTGMVTNAPGEGRSILVTNTPNFKTSGNSSMGDGNVYMYPVGLGHNSPIPGVNSGSDGWFRDFDSAKSGLVRDSYGRAQLFPDPDEQSGAYINISDIEVGEFLDTIYYNRTNRYNVASLHLDYVYSAAAGNFPNNTIATPPTPNPPPLGPPVGMRPTGIILDEYDILEEGAFTMMGREVFPPDLLYLPLMGPRQWTHLEHGFTATPPQYPDKPFPPNTPGPAMPWAAGGYIQNGPLAESCTFYQAFGYAGPSYGARQQIGNFLFAADKANNEVKVINSNSMELITTLNDGIRGPDQLAVSPDLRSLYISNGAGGSVVVYDVDPRSVDFFYPKTIINVGKLPKGIGIQPEYEDVFVCNYGSNSVSIINASTNTVRKTMTTLLKKPWDVVLTPRQQSFGWGTQTYYGYISNYGDDNVVIFESGPDGVGGVGYDNILDPVPLSGTGGATYVKVERPRGLCADHLYLDNVNSSLNLTGGCFVAHSSSKGAAVSRINFISQQAPWGPIYLIPNSGSIGGTPGFGARQFEITSQWTAQDGFLSGYQDAADVVMPDFNRQAWLNSNFSGNAYVTSYGAVGNNPIFLLPNNNKHPIRYLSGVPNPTWYPDLIFVSYKSTKTIDVIDIVNGTTKSITNLPAAATTLKAFFKI